MKEWCEENAGKYNYDWYYSNAEDEIGLLFYFKDEKVAMTFSLLFS